eukprot:1673745-Prymnesium_polylepis.1
MRWKQAHLQLARRRPCGSPPSSNSRCRRAALLRRPVTYLVGFAVLVVCARDAYAVVEHEVVGVLPVVLDDAVERHLRRHRPAAAEDFDLRVGAELHLAAE